MADRAEIVRQMAESYQLPHGITERGVDIGLAAALRAWSEFSKFIALEHDTEAKVVAAHVFYIAMQGALAEKVFLSELAMLAIAAKHRKAGGPQP